MAKDTFTLEIDLPESPCFLMAFPCPLKDLIEVAQNPVEGVIKSKGKEYRVLRGDYLRFRLDQLSELHCLLAYGHGKDWVRCHLKGLYPVLKDDSFVAFFLFTYLPEHDTRTNHSANT